MLSTTCWVIVQGFNEIEGRVYLHKEDAEAALPVVQQNPAWKQSEHIAPLTLAERTLVLAFGVTDQRVPAEAILPVMGTLPLPLYKSSDSA